MLHDLVASHGSTTSQQSAGARRYARTGDGTYRLEPIAERDLGGKSEGCVEVWRASCSCCWPKEDQEVQEAVSGKELQEGGRGAGGRLPPGTGPGWRTGGWQRCNRSPDQVSYMEYIQKFRARELLDIGIFQTRPKRQKHMHLTNCK